MVYGTYGSLYVFCRLYCVAACCLARFLAAYGCLQWHVNNYAYYSVANSLTSCVAFSHCHQNLNGVLSKN